MEMNTMVFWKKAAHFVVETMEKGEKKLSEGIKDLNEDKYRYLKIFERYSDRELIDISEHNTNLAKKLAAIEILKSRGYSR